MELTKLLYLENFKLFNNNATIIGLKEENNKLAIILDQTIFYPQGGGQPYDQGIIENQNGTFIVQEVRFIDGYVHHIGFFEKGNFQIADNVNCIVNEERRNLHTRLHSAGHVIDMAVSALNLNWIPGKGYHFPDGPYIEYTGAMDDLDKEKLKIEIENLANQFVQESKATKILFMSKDEMKKVCHHVPDFLPEDKPLRVIMYGDFGVPCGGTHVEKLGDINKIYVRNIKLKDGKIRIGYDIA